MISPLESSVKKLRGELGSAGRWMAGAHLRNRTTHDAEYLPARLAREPEIRDAISEMCVAWATSGKWHHMTPEVALHVWERIVYAFGHWMIVNRLSVTMNEQETLVWLLVTAWGDVSVAWWRGELALAKKPTGFGALTSSYFP